MTVVDPRGETSVVRRYGPVIVQLAGVAAFAAGFGLLAVWAGLVAAGLGLLAFGLAAEMAGDRWGN